MDARGRQFCTPVLVPYAALYFSFTLSRDFLHFLSRDFFLKYAQITSEDRNEFKGLKYIPTKSNRGTVYIFTKINCQTDDNPDKTVPKITLGSSLRAFFNTRCAMRCLPHRTRVLETARRLFRKLLNERPL